MSFRCLHRCVLLFTALLTFSNAAFAEDIKVAAASDLNYAIKEIIKDFENTTGHKVSLTLGSSGNFYAQMTNGAPFEVFLSADVAYPRQLEAAGIVEKGSVIVYAVGKIVLWIPNTSRLEPQKTQMKTLLDPTIKRVAIANPEHAPYGRAAVAALQRAGVYESVKSRLVLGESISQAAQFVQSGAADAGIIALSLALADSMKTSGRYWEIPADSYPKIEQGAGLIKNPSPAARMFVEWLRRSDTRQTLTLYGFGLP